MEAGQTFESPSATTVGCAVETCPTKRKERGTENSGGVSRDGSCRTRRVDEKASHGRTSSRQVAARSGGKSEASSEADCRENLESDCDSALVEDTDDTGDIDWDPAENEDADFTTLIQGSAGHGKMARGGSDKSSSRGHSKERSESKRAGQHNK